MTTADPIDQLIASGISVRTLVSHYLISVEWLAAHNNDTFRLCYFGDDGAVVVDTAKGAAALMRRAKEIGWTPNESEPNEKGAPELFNEAIHNVRRGVHWFASATDDTFDMLPLAWPASALHRSRKREDRARAKVLREKEAQAKRAAASKKAASREAYKASIDGMTRRHMERSAKSGNTVSYSAARRKVVKEVNELAAQINVLAASRDGKNGSAKL